MIDDHDRCEWVNVYSGTGSPGLSRTKSRQLYNGCVRFSISHLFLLKLTCRRTSSVILSQLTAVVCTVQNKKIASKAFSNLNVTLLLLLLLLLFYGFLTKHAHTHTHTHTFVWVTVCMGNNRDKFLQMYQKRTK